MKRTESILQAVLVVAVCAKIPASSGSASRPDILFILADDLGCGDGLDQCRIGLLGFAVVDKSALAQFPRWKSQQDLHNLIVLG